MDTVEGLGLVTGISTGIKAGAVLSLGPAVDRHSHLAFLAEQPCEQGIVIFKSCFLENPKFSDRAVSGLAHQSQTMYTEDPGLKPSSVPCP